MRPHAEGVEVGWRAPLQSRVGARCVQIEYRKYYDKMKLQYPIPPEKAPSVSALHMQQSRNFLRNIQRPTAGVSPRSARRPTMPRARCEIE